MGAEQSTRPLQARVLVAFIALAALSGPVTTYTFGAFDSEMRGQSLAGAALSSLLAGTFLLFLSIAHRERPLRARQWLVILALLFPQWLALSLTRRYSPSVSWLHATPSGVAFLLSLAAPLWLGLLSSLQLIAVEAPRAVIAAAIAGIGAVCLVAPTDAYSVLPNQFPMVLIHLLLSVLIVFTWTYARPRLAPVGTFAAAGPFLLLSAIGNAGLWRLLERGSWEPVGWREVALPLLVEAAVIAASTYLWFWLLQRMTLAAFAMQPLAEWTAGAFQGLVFIGFLEWRLDAALAISLVAIAVALRARTGEEQPTTLGLRSP